MIMSEVIETLLMFVILIGALILSLQIAGWKIRKAADQIILDLKTQKALDPGSAVMISFKKRSPFHVGMRDYRPKALELLVKQKIVRALADDKYYLLEDVQNPQT
jgi:hypothetical protein